jgi:hypothetical protein
MTPATLSGWVTDEAAKKRYVDAFQKSDFPAMLNFYKATTPECRSAPPLLPHRPAGLVCCRLQLLRRRETCGRFHPASCCENKSIDLSDEWSKSPVDLVHAASMGE